MGNYNPVKYCSFPAGNAEFYQVASAKPCIADVMLLLKKIQNGDCLMLEAGAEPFC